MLTNAFAVSITFCTFDNNGYGGLYLYAPSGVVTATDCVMTNNRQMPAMYGSSFGSLRFARNHIVGNTVTIADYNAAVYLYLEGYPSGLIIDSNTLDRNVADMTLYVAEWATG